MKLRNINSRSTLYSVVGALLLIAGPASADQADPRLTVAFISDAAQANAIVRKQYDQAIDKLEDLLNGGMSSGTSNMFGPREYVTIYT